MSDKQIPLRVEGLTKSFRQGSQTVNALSDFDFQLESGQFIAFMGASGSGKSTLLHLMAGLTSVDAGKVWVEGNELSAMSDRRLTAFRRRRIGIVFQALNLVPTLSALENVCLPLQADNSNQDIPQVAMHWLEKLGIADRASHLPGAMSGGEQQRVAIARALSIRPAILLADEPTGNLDSQNSHSLCQQLKDLNQEEGRSIVMVTHEPDVAIWADRVIILRDGRFLAELQTSDFKNAEELSRKYHQITNSSDKVDCREAAAASTDRRGVLA